MPELYLGRLAALFLFRLHLLNMLSLWLLFSNAFYTRRRVKPFLRYRPHIRVCGQERTDIYVLSIFLFIITVPRLKNKLNRKSVFSVQQIEYGRNTHGK